MLRTLGLLPGFLAAFASAAPAVAVADVEARMLLVSASRDLAPGSRALSDLGMFTTDRLLLELGGESAVRLVAPLPPPTTPQMPGCNVGRYEDTRALANAPAASPSPTGEDAGSSR